MSRGRVFENMGAAWLFKFWNSLGARSSGRSAKIVRFEIPWNFLKVNINLHFWRLRVKITFFRTRAEFTVSLLCEPGRLKLQKENRISGLQKRKISPSLRANRKRGKSTCQSFSASHITWRAECSFKRPTFNCPGVNRCPIRYAWFKWT